MFNVKSAVTNTLGRVYDRLAKFKQIAAENKKELVRGSVLDPYNHPSYTPEVRKAHLERAEQRAELQRQIEALS